MGDGRLALRAVDLRVQVTQAARRRVGQPQQRCGVQRALLEEVAQRAALVVVSDEEELCEGTCSLDVGCNEAWKR